MKESSSIMFLIKFGQKTHLESLLNNGELYFSSPIKYNSLKELNDEQGDENEGAEWIDNLLDVKIQVSHPELGNLNFKSLPNKPVKLTQFNHNYLTTSFYLVSSTDIQKTGEIQIDKRMSSFGDHALIILNPKTFIDNILDSADSKKIALSSKVVEYQDLSALGKIEMNPFIKKIEHQYQQEFRIVLKNFIKENFVLNIEKHSIEGILVPVEKNKPFILKVEKVDKIE